MNCQSVTSQSTVSQFDLELFRTRSINELTTVHDICVETDSLTSPHWDDIILTLTLCKTRAVDGRRDGGWRIAHGVAHAGNTTQYSVAISARSTHHSWKCGCQGRPHEVNRRIWD